MNAIEIKNLTKVYGTKTVVDNLSLTVPKGELFALLGVNGAGKTTTIKMLNCLVMPTKGDAELMGHSIISEPKKVKEITNVSPQETAVAPLLSVKENLIFAAGIYGASKQESEQKAMRMMSVFRLTDRTSDRAGTLSGGYQRRLSIAMGMISSPEILFLDEPTLGLDVLARRELWATVTHLKGKVTMVLTTHYLEEAVALADRIGIMANGKLLMVGTADEIISKTGCKNFEDAFVKIASAESDGKDAMK